MIFVIWIGLSVGFRLAPGLAVGLLLGLGLLLFDSFFIPDFFLNKVVKDIDRTRPNTGRYISLLILGLRGMLFGGGGGGGGGEDEEDGLEL